MIIEGFDIENWSCIRKASVANLPATGRRRAARAEPDRQEQHREGAAGVPHGLSVQQRGGADQGIVSARDGPQADGDGGVPHERRPVSGHEELRHQQERTPSAGRRWTSGKPRRRRRPTFTASFANLSGGDDLRKGCTSFFGRRRDSSTCRKKFDDGVCRKAARHPRRVADTARRFLSSESERALERVALRRTQAGQGAVAQKDLHAF